MASPGHAAVRAGLPTPARRGGRVALLVSCLALAAAPGPATAQDDAAAPALTGRVVDRADLLDPAREAALAATLEAHEARTSNQVVVATVPTLGGRDVAGYAIELANAWALGDAERDNGALLLVAPTEREVRIEVGRGLEGALTDVRSGTIIRDEILPAFRSGDYPAGIERGVAAMLASIDGEYVAAPTSTRTTDASDGVSRFVPFVFLAMIAIPELLRRTGRRRAANGAFPAGFAGLLATVVSGKLVVGLVAAVALFALLYAAGRGGGGRGGPGGGSRGRGTRRRGAGLVVPVGGGFGGGLGGGGFGGGGFGGGGGGFGGGGASGGW